MKFKSQAMFLGLLVISAIGAVADTKMAYSHLPAAVQNAAEKEMQNGRVAGARSEEEGGRMTYEVEITENGKTRDLTFDGSGRLLEVEQQVHLNALPPAARTALQQRAGDNKIEKVESVTARQSVSYEATITKRNGKHTEVAVNPDGSPHRD